MENSQRFWDPITAAKNELAPAKKQARKKAVKRVVFADSKNVYVIRKGKTSNKKISDGSELVQTYTFSREQYNLANSGTAFKMADFFALDGSNCLDCIFSGNQRAKNPDLKVKCYTHKIMQYSGMLSMLRSIAPSELTNLSILKERQILSMTFNTYVRFGTYGEPSLLPYQLVKDMARTASNWTGYTHQASKEWAEPYNRYFMGSVHSAQ